jgi:WD40 repeat protein
MSEAKNQTYTIGGPVKSGACYVERESDHELLESLRRGLFCYVLTSRQMGKTSLLNRVRKRLEEERYICIELDLSGEIGRNKDEYPDFPTWFAALTSVLADKFEDKFDDLSLDVWRRKDGQREDNQHPTLHRLNKLFEHVLLAYPKANIVIFIDEIDNVLGLPFKVDDFFSCLRSYYNRRSNDTYLERLTFVLSGVAAPSELIQDKKGTPFNIGKAIDLKGFGVGEAIDLAKGLADKADNPRRVLEMIITHWTNGQPFLTQKICSLVLESPDRIIAGAEIEGIQNIVQKKLIENWNKQDKPQHFLTIQERLLGETKIYSLADEERIESLLKLYHQILENGLVHEDSSFEQTELLLSGLVVRQDDELKIFNEIYKQIFDQNWVRTILANLRPYRESYDAWCNDETDTSRLLRGKALEQAQEWASNKELTRKERDFLDASKKFEQEEKQKEASTQTALAKAEQARIQAEAKAKRTRAKALLVFFISLAIAAVSIANFFANRWWHQLLAEKLAHEALEKPSKLEALALATQSGQYLEKTLGSESSSIDQYSTVQPLFALQQQLSSIYEKNQIRSDGRFTSVSFSSDFWEVAGSSSEGYVAAGSEDGFVFLRRGQETISWKAHENQVESVTFNRNGQLIATAGKDQKIKIWNVPDIFEKSDKESISNFIPTDSDPLKLSDKAHQVHLNEQPLAAQQLDVPVGWGRSLSFNSSGERIALGGDSKVYWWTKEGTEWSKQPLTWTIGSRVEAVVFSPTLENENTLAVGDGSGLVHILDLSDDRAEPKEPVLRFPQAERVTSLSFSSDGNLVSAVGDKGTLKFAAFSQLSKKWVEQPLSEKIKASSSISRVMFSRDGKFLATAGTDSTISVYEISRQSDPSNVTTPIKVQLLKRLKGHEGEIWDITFVRDQQLITAGEDGTVRTWNITDIIDPDLLNSSRQNSIKQIVVGSDSKAVVVVQQDGKAYLWKDPESEPWKKEESPLDLQNISCFDPASDNSILLDSTAPSILSVNVSSSSSDQRVAISTKAGVCILRDYTGEMERQLPTGGAVQTVHFGPDDQQVTLLQENGKVSFWDLPSQQKQTVKLDPEPQKVDQIFFSPLINAVEKRRIVTLIGDQVRLWKPNGEKAGDPIKETLGGVNNIDFSPSGRLVGMAGKNGKVHLWAIGQDIKKDAPIELETHQGKAWISFSPSQNYIASLGEGDRSLRVYQTNLSSQFSSSERQSSPYLIRVPWTIDPEIAPTGLKFSPNGQLIAVTLQDGTIQLWDVKGRKVFQFDGAKPESEQQVLFEFSPDGKWAIFVNPDHRLQLEPLTLRGLLEKSCDWLEDYRSTNQAVANQLKKCP